MRTGLARSNAKRKTTIMYVVNLQQCLSQSESNICNTLEIQNTWTSYRKCFIKTPATPMAISKLYSWQMNSHIHGKISHDHDIATTPLMKRQQYLWKMITIPVGCIDLRHWCMKKNHTRSSISIRPLALRQNSAAL